MGQFNIPLTQWLGERKIEGKASINDNLGKVRAFLLPPPPPAPRPILTGAPSSLAPHPHWRPILTGAPSSLTPHPHWRPILTGAPSSLAPHPHWRPILTGAPSPGMLCLSTMAQSLLLRFSYFSTWEESCRTWAKL